MTSSMTVLNCCAPVASDAGSALRAARAGDLPGAVALLTESGLPTQGVADYFESGYAVIEKNGKLLAVAGLEVHGDDALLRSVAVASTQQGRGLGETVVLDRLAWARERGIRDVYLLTTTAREFFTRFGFEPIERAAVSHAVQQSLEFTAICGSESTAMRVSVADGADIRAVVREKYGAAARASSEGVSCSCCGDGKTKPWDPVTSDLYEEGETQGIPAEALLASLGCGNPTALAELKEGETVLDLGSGGGIDVLLSARRVGPAGKAYGLDMTDEMLALARASQRKSGVQNVEFLKGEIEHIPLPDNSVD
ncbi:MAG TPA: arsenic resistance N-acetyltransferase ArsN2, partial [Longimicrobiales bacterium]